MLRSAKSHEVDPRRSAKSRLGAPKARAARSSASLVSGVAHKSVGRSRSRSSNERKSPFYVIKRAQMELWKDTRRPPDDAATKLIWLALRNITADRGRSVRKWREAMNQFAIAYGDRFTRPAA